MSTMHAAITRLNAARHARARAHAEAVTSGLQDRPESQPPAGQHAPAGPAFPLPTQGGGDDGQGSRDH